MREEEAFRVLRDMVQLLESSDVGLNVLVEQHRDAVENGRMVEVVAESSTGRARKSTAEKLLPSDVRRRGLTVTEQLASLFDLVEVAVVGTVAVEARVVEMAREFLPADGDPAIVFSYDAADLADIESPSLATAADSPTKVTAPNQARMSAAREILDILSELRKVTDVPRSDWLKPQEERLKSKSSPEGE